MNSLVLAEENPYVKLNKQSMASSMRVSSIQPSVQTPPPLPHPRMPFEQSHTRFQVNPQSQQQLQQQFSENTSSTQQMKSVPSRVNMKINLASQLHDELYRGRPETHQQINQDENIADEYQIDKKPLVKESNRSYCSEVNEAAGECIAARETEQRLREEICRLQRELLNSQLQLANLGAVVEKIQSSKDLLIEKVFLIAESLSLFKQEVSERLDGLESSVPHKEQQLHQLQQFSSRPIHSDDLIAQSVIGYQNSQRSEGEEKKGHSPPSVNFDGVLEKKLSDMEANLSRTLRSCLSQINPSQSSHKDGYSLPLQELVESNSVIQAEQKESQSSPQKQRFESSQKNMRVAQLLEKLQTKLVERQSKVEELAEQEDKVQKRRQTEELTVSKRKLEKSTKSNQRATNKNFNEDEDFLPTRKNHYFK